MASKFSVVLPFRMLNKKTQKKTASLKITSVIEVTFAIIGPYLSGGCVNATWLSNPCTVNTEK